LSEPAPPDRPSRLLGQVRKRLEAARDSSPAADHLVRAVDRFLDVQGSLLAAGITYYAFLALFPLAAVGFGLTAVIARLVPSVDVSVKQQVADILPAGTDLSGLTSAGLVVGLIGLGVLLYAGVRWLAAMRRSLTLIWGRHPRDVPYLRGLLRDILSLALLGACVLGSLALSVLSQYATAFSSNVLGGDSGLQAVIVRAAGLLVALLVDFAVVYALFWGLAGDGPDGPGRGRALVPGALIGALGFEVLKQAGAVIVSSASSNVVYGTFAVTVGLIVWIAYVSRWLLLVACWTATSGSGDAAEG
jgi:membrane protein